jgi:hypothetical protein
MKKLAILALPLFLLSSPAFAATGANLGVSVTPPSGVHVYEAGTYSVRVDNTGNKNASSVMLSIQLPVTHTSPQVYIMGDLGTFSSSCTLAGTALSCSLGTINRGAWKSVSFTISMPYSTAPLVIDATATTTTNDTNPANNHLAYTATPLTTTYPVTAPDLMLNSHCTGTGLTSFYECTRFPSSIASFDSILETDGSITIIGAPPNNTGEWTQTGADSLLIEYFEDGLLSASLDARSVDADCYEGPMTFYPPSPYLAMYRVCRQ